MSKGLGTSHSAANYTIGAGHFSFCNLDPTMNPNKLFRSMGNCAAAELAWEINTISHYDATRGTREEDARAELSRSATLTLTVEESDPLKYALACFGEAVLYELPQTSLRQVARVSPGSEVFLTIPNTDTPAYNYTGLAVQLLNGTAASIGQPTVDSTAGVSAGTGTITTSGTYTGVTSDNYYIEIDTENTTPQTITDAKFKWRKGLAGTWSEAITVTGTAQAIGTEGVEVTFAAGSGGQDFNEGDVYTFTVSPALTTLTQGKDYTMDKVDVRNGKVLFPTSSGIDMDTDVVITCTVPAQKIPRVYAGVNKAVEGIMRFEYDPTYGRQKAYTFYHVRIAPEGTEALIQDDWANMQLSCAVLADEEHSDPENPDSKYFRIDYPSVTEGVIVGKDS